ncbi:hypothetical protein G6F50_016872 [Rhizopus delemar]|uniref:Uncharacterized protein n=1 Tax=Rhizopus delemar TaxID=936053 RepID=A0A9P6XS93_9FUNG|nr:hypothetical protein G6F50_016872 [Rhizopus delemar]
MLEAPLLVQPDAAIVRRVDAANQHVHLIDARTLDQHAHHGLAQAHAAEPPGDVDRMLHRILECGPRAKRAVAGKRHQLARRVLDPHHGKAALLLGLEPALHRLARPRLVVVERRRVDDGVVEDGQYLVRMAFMRAVDKDGAIRRESFSGRGH